ncbi:MAG: septum formation protein Maf [Bacteroidetes bacterium]|nr:MAG: septum formation protein Maf [Bacteroidota bacterium]
MILASKSPRRKALLEELKWEFLVVEANIDEDRPAHLVKKEHAEYLSIKKAAAILIDSERDIVVAADTVVYLGESHLGKPENLPEARTMLNSLSGKRHEVITGVTMRTLRRTITFSCVTEVQFAILSKDDIETYIEEYNPYDKAGSYGIQELITPDGERIGPLKIDKVVGSYTNVMGLPINELQGEMKGFSIPK